MSLTTSRTPSGPQPPLSERARRVLAALVRQYIEHAEPVSSLWLAQHGALGVSSATVRNILASLETHGCVHQPHTSAGRVPTDLGYRFYVDQLLQARRPARSAPDVEARLRQAGTVEDVLVDASHELSRASHHIGFVLALDDDTTFRQIDFAPLDGTKVLVILIATGGHITHKVVELGEVVASHELRQAANYLNSAFAGLPLQAVRRTVIDRLAKERTLYDRLMARALQLANSTFETVTPRCTLVVQGASSLLTEIDVAGEALRLGTLRALFRMIEEKHRLVRLLNEYIDGPGLTVVIGAEHRTPDLRNFSLVASTHRDGDRTGTVGVIGPTRMRYSRAISIVDTFSSAVNRVLNSTS
jgi:heat-inducible transcriptional repressor